MQKEKKKEAETYSCYHWQCKKRTKKEAETYSCYHWQSKRRRKRRRRRIDVICRNAQCIDVICGNAQLLRDERGRDTGMLPVAMQKEESEEENEKNTAVRYGCHLSQCSRHIIIIVMITIKAHGAACAILQVQRNKHKNQYKYCAYIQHHSNIINKQGSQLARERHHSKTSTKTRVTYGSSHLACQ